MQWLVWAANAVGELISVAPSLSAKVAKERVAYALSAYVKLFTDGNNVAEFARLVQSPKNTVWLWCNGKNLPRLDTLVQLCFRLRISVSDLLTHEQIEITNDPIRSLPGNCVRQKRRAAIGLTDLKQAESQLVTVLLNHKLPPPSLEATARALGYRRETLSHNFRDLCRAISARYIYYEKDRYLNSIEECCREVRQVVLQLYTQDIYPTEARVSQYLTKPGHLRYKKVRTVLQETRRTLRLKK